MAATENHTFLDSKVKNQEPTPGCCRSTPMKGCCIATGVFGVIFVILGILVLLLGKPMLESKIQSSMALTEGSDRFESWLRPPVQPHLYAYVFHVVNPQAVLKGRKPILEEKGPYVYKSTTDKDSDDNIVRHGDGTLTYRPRKIYHYEPSLSGPGLNPEKDFITIPNIPLWTGLNGLKGKSDLAKGVGRDLVTGNGLGTPFINVSFRGLLWGYNDDLPCLKLDEPAGCASGDSPFSSNNEDDIFGDSGSEDDEWDFKRKKRSVSDDDIHPVYGRAKPKAEYVNCTCEWGLFRDRNITMRKPLQIFTGETDLTMKGVVRQYDGKSELSWWKKGSICDAVKGQDSSTLPPSITQDKVLEIYIALMCRTINMTYEKDVEHAGINTYRFIPPENAMGAHDDPDKNRVNPDNECYCLKDENFKCFKSGVTNMQPCKRDTNAPLALSMPHFYQADQSYIDAVIGLKPEKEKHQFYMDVVPEFGFPLAIRPRFQLNVVIGSGVDKGWDKISKMQDELILPFLWAQDGFDEPSEKMAEQIKFGLEAPEKLPLMGAVLFFVIAGVLLLISLGYFIWVRVTAPKNSGSI